MNHWNHRLVKFLKDNKYPCYAICEVYYDEKNVPFSRTGAVELQSFPNPNLGTTDEEAIKQLKETFESMAEAFKAPILIWDELQPYESPMIENNEKATKQASRKNI